MCAAPTNATAFRKGSMPFTKWSNYSMGFWSLDESCEYYAGAGMIFYWWSPADVDEDALFRFKLRTDEPATTRFSGKMRFLGGEECRYPDVGMSGSMIDGGWPLVKESGVNWEGWLLLGAAFLATLCICWLVPRAIWKPRRVTLK